MEVWIPQEYECVGSKPVPQQNSLFMGFHVDLMCFPIFDVVCMFVSCFACASMPAGMTFLPGDHSKLPPGSFKTIPGGSRLVLAGS